MSTDPTPKRLAQIRSKYDKLITLAQRSTNENERQAALGRAADLRERYPAAFVDPDPAVDDDSRFDWRALGKWGAQFAAGAFSVLNGDSLAANTAEINAMRLPRNQGLHLHLSMTRRDLRRLRRLGPVELQTWADAIGRRTAAVLLAALTAEATAAGNEGEPTPGAHGG